MVSTNLVIPGIKTIHQRQAWEDPRYPVAGPTATGVFEDMVGHYPGTGDVPDHDYRGHVYVDPARFRGDLFGFYREMQKSYLDDRDYSVGYLFGIDYLGGLTVLRGFDFRNAANAGSKLPGNWNLRSGSAIFVVDLDQEATNLALYTFAMLTAFLRHHGHRAAIKRHDDGEYTACPGRVGAQLSAGLGEPSFWQKVGPPLGAAPLPPYLRPNPPLPPPVVQPPTEGDHSVLTHLIKRKNDPAVFAQYSGGYKTWVPDEPTRDVLIMISGKQIQEIPREAVALWKASGPVLGPIPAGYDGWGLRT